MEIGSGDRWTWTKADLTVVVRGPPWTGHSPSVESKETRSQIDTVSGSVCWPWLFSGAPSGAELGRASHGHARCIHLSSMPPSTQEHTVVAIYESHVAAEAALKALQKAGLDMKRLSIIGKDFHTEEHALGFYSSGDRMKFWGTRGAFWGSLWGVLFGSAFFFIPVFGPLVVMGPLVGWLVSALEGAALGGAAGVLAAAFASIGIPDDSIVKYEFDVKAGKFLVLARGTPEMIAHAHVVLGTTGASLLVAHAA